MTTQKPHRLGDLQLKIMKLLWQRKEASVHDILAGLSTEQELAYTTVATMLRKMEARKLVSHRVEERSFIYQPAVPEESVTRNMADHLLERLFSGSVANLVSHLLTTREVSREELAKLEKIISEKRRKK